MIIIFEFFRASSKFTHQLFDKSMIFNLMEPSTFFIDQEIKLKKADLEILREDEYCDSSWYSVCELSNVEYCISINPYKKRRRFRKKSALFIVVDLGRATHVDVDAEFTIQNFSGRIKKTYNDFGGEGAWICDTSQLFDPKNNCFTDGEMIVKIKGSFKIHLHRIKYPFSAQWKIKESDLKALKNKGFFSEDLTVSSGSDIKYYISFYPNGDDDEESQGEAWIFLQFMLGANPKIEAVWKLFIDSADFKKEKDHIFEDTVDGWGRFVCSTEDLFNPKNGYFNNGELTLKITGTIMVETEKEPTILALENGIVQKGYHRGKNFTFIIGEKTIKVHKHVLKSASPVFAGMFESNLKEVKEKKIEIVDFEYEIVHAAMKLLYSTPLPQSFTFEQMIDVLQFADKYEIDLIKDAVQDYLIQRISPTNVCHLMNATTTFINAPKLLSSCKEYLIDRLTKKEAVHGLDLLDKDFMFNILLEISTPHAKNF